MTAIREMNISFTEWESKLLLELLISECNRLRKICETSLDEDEQADAGNEFMEADGLRERFEGKAEEIFGASIMRFLSTVKTENHSAQ